MFLTRLDQGEYSNKGGENPWGKRKKIGKRRKKRKRRNGKKKNGDPFKKLSFYLFLFTVSFEFMNTQVYLPTFLSYTAR